MKLLLSRLISSWGATLLSVRHLAAKVSEAKTKIFFSRNVHASRTQDMSRVVGFSITGNLGRYLGVPLLHKRQTCATYKHLVERVRSRLASWKVNTLSFAGRVTFVQSIIASFPTYTMQSTMLPKGVCQKIEGLMRNFIWGSTEQNRKWHSISWEGICKPKQLGGLGLKRLHLFDKAMIMKLA